MRIQNEIQDQLIAELKSQMNFRERSIFRRSIRKVDAKTPSASRLCLKIILGALVFVIHFGLLFFVWKYSIPKDGKVLSNSYEQAPMYENVAAFRSKVDFEMEKEENDLTKTFPTVWVKSPNGRPAKPFFGVRGHGRCSKPQFSGAVTVAFLQSDSGQMQISEIATGRIFGYGYNVEYESYGRGQGICAHLKITIHNGGECEVDVTDGCIYLDELMHRWGTASRLFVGNKKKADYPPEAKRAQVWGIFFPSRTANPFHCSLHERHRNRSPS